LDYTFIKNNIMKKIKITLVLALFASAVSLSSCGKKGCHKPDDKKAKHPCSHSNDSNSDTSTESGT
jgi:predicted small lipoprotein YifL